MDPDLTEKVLKGHKAAGKIFKVHLDGYNFPSGLFSWTMRFFLSMACASGRLDGDSET